MTKNDKINHNDADLNGEQGVPTLIDCKPRSDVSMLRLSSSTALLGKTDRSEHASARMEIASILTLIVFTMK